jgi:hypothetical protein
MGNIAAPTIANIYIFILESSFLTISAPLSYNRLIDDLFIIYLEDFFEIASLKNHFSQFGLTLNEESGDLVNFLNLYIKYDIFTKKLNFSVFTKSTNTHAYLLPSSNHPSFICKNIPLSLFISFRRICTDITDYWLITNKIIGRFIARSYDFARVLKIANTVACMKRDDLIPYKKKKPIVLNNSFSVAFDFDRNFKDLSLIVNSNFYLICNKFNYPIKYSINIVNRIQPSIGAMLIHNIFSFRFFSNYCKFKRCDSVNCKICAFSSQKNFLDFNGFIIPISKNTDCKSENVIYLIKCLKCNAFYVGQSERSCEKRLNEHISSIRNFVAYEKNLSEVSFHFNLTGHSPKDFSFYILNKDLIDLTLRLHTEAKFIYLFKHILKQNVLNSKEPSIYNIFGLKT